MRAFAILTASTQDIGDVVPFLSPESFEDMQGFEQDPAKWPGMVEKMLLDCEGAYSVHAEGHALCLFGMIYVGDDTFETWMIYRDEFKQLRGVTDAIRALFDAEFFRAARQIKRLKVRVLSRLTLPQSADWLQLLGFSRTERRIVTPSGKTAYIFERVQ